ncbi:Protein of unknown function [Gryllus bimaculatus]|nr:Protein of unknown function [Gryllus bimaculatus]
MYVCEYAVTTCVVKVHTTMYAFATERSNDGDSNGDRSMAEWPGRMRLGGSGVQGGDGGKGYGELGCVALGKRSSSLKKNI